MQSFTEQTYSLDRLLQFRHDVPPVTEAELMLFPKVVAMPRTEGRDDTSRRQQKRAAPIGVVTECIPGVPRGLWDAKSAEIRRIQETSGVELTQKAGLRGDTIMVQGPSLLVEKALPALESLLLEPQESEALPAAVDGWETEWHPTVAHDIVQAAEQGIPGLQLSNPMTMPSVEQFPLAPSAGLAPPGLGLPERPMPPEEDYDWPEVDHDMLVPHPVPPPFMSQGAIPRPAEPVPAPPPFIAPLEESEPVPPPPLPPPPQPQPKVEASPSQLPGRWRSRQQASANATQVEQSPHAQRLPTQEQQPVAAFLVAEACLDPTALEVKQSPNAKLLPTQEQQPAAAFLPAEVYPAQTAFEGYMNAGRVVEEPLHEEFVHGDADDDWSQGFDLSWSFGHIPQEREAEEEVEMEEEEPEEELKEAGSAVAHGMGLHTAFEERVVMESPPLAAHSDSKVVEGASTSEIEDWADVAEEQVEAFDEWCECNDAAPSLPPPPAVPQKQPAAPVRPPPPAVPQPQQAAPVRPPPPPVPTAKKAVGAERLAAEMAAAKESELEVPAPAPAPPPAPVEEPPEPTEEDGKRKKANKKKDKKNKRKEEETPAAEVPTPMKAASRPVKSPTNFSKTAFAGLAQSSDDEDEEVLAARTLLPGRGENDQMAPDKGGSRNAKAKDSADSSQGPSITATSTPNAKPAGKQAAVNGGLVVTPKPPPVNLPASPPPASEGASPTIAAKASRPPPPPVPGAASQPPKAAAKAASPQAKKGGVVPKFAPPLPASVSVWGDPAKGSEVLWPEPPVSEPSAPSTWSTPKVPAAKGKAPSQPPSSSSVPVKVPPPKAGSSGGSTPKASSSVLTAKAARAQQEALQAQARAADPLPQRKNGALKAAQPRQPYAVSGENAASGPKWAERPVEKINPTTVYEEEVDPELARYIWDRKTQRSRGAVAVSAAPVPPPMAPAARVVPPSAQKQKQLLRQVIEMGFDEDSARQALRTTNWAGVEEALNALLG